MKRTLLTLLLPAVITTGANAQLSNGGFPISMQAGYSAEAPEPHYYPLPDWGAAQATAKLQAARKIATPYIVGLFTSADISFPQSGRFTYLANGHKIWRAQIRIEDAPAIGLYYDRFHLPDGVSYYLTNANNRQVLGAYTSRNNAAHGRFAQEPIQGSVVNMELDIAPQANTEAIQLHIERALVYFTSVSYLSRYQDNNIFEAEKPSGDPDPFGLEGSSSTCEINAVCPLGVRYPIPRKATLQLIIPLNATQAGACSATMINNTGNSTASCKPYILTATHCDANNYTSSDSIPFTDMLLRFNFEKENCTGGNPATVNTLNGVNLVARANYNDTPDPQINGDFMLLEPLQSIPDDWDVYLAGWNRSPNLPGTVTAPNKYIGFHHAAADIKKVTSSQQVDPNGDGGGSEGPGTHWRLTADSGGIEQGSSGSALFDQNGYAVGVASIAENPDFTCGTNSKGGQALFLREVHYSKLSYDWDYSIDGPSGFRKLKPWLDPANTGAITIDPVKSDCSAPTTGIGSLSAPELDRFISVYPNPSTGNKVNVRFNLEEAADIGITVYNIAGQKLRSYNLAQVKNKTVTLDMNGYANGIYLLRFSANGSVSSRKIMLTK